MKKRALVIVLLMPTLIRGHAQLNVADVTQRFNAYQAAMPNAKLHLSFNQKKFFPGDTVFFKAYFLTEELTGIRGKQLIDFNLIDSHGRIKLHFLFSVIDGIGYNQCQIPDTLQAGVYLVTAHSSWMRNPMFIFRKEILIVRRNTLELETLTELRAAPEGGHLINGISNRVAIVTNQSGIAVQIIDEAGKEVGHTITDASGTAAIIFTPMQHLSYFARVVETSIQVPLPIAEDDRLGLFLIFDEQNNPTKIHIESPPNSNNRDQDIMLIISCRGRIYHATTFYLGRRNFTELLLPYNNLPDGVSQISLLNSSGELLASRAFYRPETAWIHAKIETSKDHFQMREKVKLEISLAKSDGQPIQGEFSINILNRALFDLGKEYPLVDELTIFLSMEKKFWIDRSDATWLSSLDNYLMTFTGGIPWMDILSKETKTPKFRFTGGIQLSGTVFHADSLKPVPDFMQIMFYFQNNRIRHQTAVNKGKFSMVIPDLYGYDKLLCFVETYFYLGGIKRGEDVPGIKIKLDETPIQLPRAPMARETETSDVYATFTTNKRLIDRSYGFYTFANKSESNSELTDWEDEIGGADVVINIKDYSLFPTMEEFVKEVIPSLQYRKTKRKNTLRVLLPDIMALAATGDPVYIIDGIATKNTDHFLSLKPSDLLFVKIIKDPKKLLPLGMMGKNGIVVVQTKNGNVHESLNDPSLVIEGLSKPLDFSKSDYSNERYLHAPNFRSTLHWNPTIKTGRSGKATVEFFCSDDVGEINIHIEGLAGGRPFSSDRSITIGIDPEEK